MLFFLILPSKLDNTPVEHFKLTEQAHFVGILKCEPL